MKQIHYLAVNRGFYRGEANYLANLPDAVIFTSNIRRATPFNSFNEAEEMFKMLLNYSDSDLTTITGYYAVLVAPLQALPCKKEAIDAIDAIDASMEQRLHAANCCCDFYGEQLMVDQQLDRMVATKKKEVPCLD